MLAPPPVLSGSAGPVYTSGVPHAPAAPARSADPEVHRLNLVWLVRLRWASIVGQSLTVLGVQYVMHIPVPLGPLFGLILLEAATNLAAALWVRRRERCGEAPVAALITFDLLLFTGLLYFTGGPTNPFSSLYLVHIALATLVLRPRLTWALVGLTLLCSAGLFVAYVPLPMGAHAATGQFGTHLRGMWVALGIAASFIVYFLSRVVRSLAVRDAALERARESAQRHQQMAALATLAAGAAHELAQPLSTIAVVAKELERSLEGAEDGHVDDARLIRTEVARCNDILGELAAGTGQPRGEGGAPSSLPDIVSAALEGLRDAERVAIDVEEASLVLPARLLGRALRSVVANALDATADGGKVELRARVVEGRLRIEIHDDGTGMSGEALRRATEPFFTTKPTGKGMGLGLFLASSIVDQLGGELRLASQPGSGTTVTLELSL